MKNMSLSNLLANAGETFLLQIIAACLLLLMHFVLANVLGAENYGIINYAITTAGIISIAASMGFHNSIMRYCAEYKETEKWNELRGILIRSFQIVLIVSILISLILAFISRLLKPEISFANSIFYAGLLLPVMTVGLWRGKAIRGMHRLRESILPEEIIRPLLIVAISIGCVFISVNLQVSDIVIVYIFSSLLAFLIGILWLLKSVPDQVKNNTSMYKTKEWLKTSVPMMWAGLLQELLVRADVIFLGILAGMELTGIYSAASRLALVNVFILKVVDLVVAPKIAAAYHGGNLAGTRDVIKKGIVISMCGAFPLFVIMLLFPGTLLGFYGDEFRQGETLLRILAVGQLVNAFTGPVGHALLMTGNEKLYSKIILVFTVFSVLSNFFAIYYFGMNGAAVATALSLGLMNISLFFVMRRKLFSEISSY